MRRDSLIQAIPFAVVGLFGVSFGVLAGANRDLGTPASVVMSVFTFAGSAQFAAISVFAAGGQAPAAIAPRSCSTCVTWPSVRP